MMHNKVSTTASLTHYCGMTYRIYPASIEKFNYSCGSLLRLILKLPPVYYHFNLAKIMDTSLNYLQNFTIQRSAYCHILRPLILSAEGHFSFYENEIL